ncbi:MAG: hypothetical protein RDU89_11665 [bacterium]|nr:hypothetical protein [bacterium]
MTASTLPRPRKRNLWSAGIEEQLWARIRERDDRPISAVIRDFCRERGLSFHTARAKYYRRLRSADEPAQAPPADTALEDLAAFLRDAAEVPGVDLAGFLGGLKTMASLAAGGRRQRDLAAEVQGLRREGEQLSGHLEECQQRLRALAEEHRGLESLVEEFTGLTSVGKVAGLGEFARNLRQRVDQIGRVARGES